MSRKQNAKSGSRKAGRNTSKCNTYKLRGTRESNKRRGLSIHLRSNKNDLDAKKCLKQI